jgi:hypothetical protein
MGGTSCARSWDQHRLDGVNIGIIFDFTWDELWSDIQETYFIQVPFLVVRM